MGKGRRRTAPLMEAKAQRSLRSVIYMQTPGDHSTMQLVEDYSVRFVLRTVGEAERESSLIGEIRAGSCSNL